MPLAPAVITVEYVQSPPALSAMGAKVIDVLLSERQKRHSGYKLRRQVVEISCVQSRGTRGICAKYYTTVSPTSPLRYPRDMCPLSPVPRYVVGSAQERGIVRLLPMISRSTVYCVLQCLTVNTDNWAADVIRVTSKYTLRG